MTDGDPKDIFLIGFFYGLMPHLFPFLGGRKDFLPQFLATLSVHL
jgi:hypothetical protein